MAKETPKNIDRIHSFIADAMSINRFTRAKTLFDEYKEHINVLFHDGCFFLFSIKYNNVDMLKSIIKHFEKTFQEENFFSKNSAYARYLLREPLIRAINMFDPTEEIVECVKKYIPDDNDLDDLEQDLSGFDDLDECKNTDTHIELSDTQIQNALTSLPTGEYSPAESKYLQQIQLMKNSKLLFAEKSPRSNSSSSIYSRNNFSNLLFSQPEENDEASAEPVNESIIPSYAS